jgi:FkbM family methyltransferase
LATPETVSLLELHSATGASMEDLIANHIPVGRVPEADAPVPAFEYPKQEIISYAQTREDVLLWRVLHNVSRGFYIDVGAHDPTALSVTRAFYDHGWHGINVEPNLLHAKKLRKERPRDLTLEVALGHRPGMATFYEFGDTGFSTLVKEIADEHIAVGFKATERRVPVTTLAAVLDDLGDQQAHFLKIDVEGYERQVLRGADFTKVRPWIVLIKATRPVTSIPSYGIWEPILLEASYEFVYFDGLNRFYVAEERASLRRYFSVPVSICDPFRDGEVVRLSGAVAELESEKVQQASLVARLSEVVADLERERMTQASEAARLSGVVADLERDRMTHAKEVCSLSAVVSRLQGDHVKHEVPRLGWGPQTSIACDARDAEGLLRIVEAQASDLVRLRRALLSSQTIASQRLQVIHADANAREHERRREIGKIFEWLRSILLGEIIQIQEAISDVTERSRWRRIGQRLGLAKRLTWETGHWQTDLFEATAESTSTADDRTPEPSISQLLVELERLRGLLDHLRLSRWRKLGHWLGLAKRFSWESGAWPDPLLTKPIPEEAMPGAAAELRERNARFSSTGIIEHTQERFLEECRGFAIDVIFDVGANTGQFAQELRKGGYHGHMISFEPLSSAHATLIATAASDPLWDVAERCAVGASDGWAEINIAGNSYSSSLLPMLDLHREAAPQSAYQGTEPRRVIALDSYIERTFSDPTTVFGLKIDTQGYESQILAGLRHNHDRVKVVFCEMSLAPLYAHGPSMSELCRLLAELGYHCVALGPKFEDPRNGELLQANGVFVKRR